MRFNERQLRSLVHVAPQALFVGCGILLGCASLAFANRGWTCSTASTTACNNGNEVCATNGAAQAAPCSEAGTQYWSALYSPAAGPQCIQTKAEGSCCADTNIPHNAWPECGTIRYYAAANCSGSPICDEPYLTSPCKTTGCPE